MPRAATVQEEARQQGIYLDPLSGQERPLVAYSTLRIGSWYYGPLLRVRRSSDDAEADIWPTAVGDLDVAALARHCGSGSGFVRTWYDQSGRGNHAVQATSGRQPRLYNAGVIESSGGQPAMRFDAAGGAGTDRLLATIPLTTTYPSWSYAAVVELLTGIDTGRRIVTFIGADGAAGEDYFHTANAVLLMTSTVATTCRHWSNLATADVTDVPVGTHIVSLVFDPDAGGIQGLRVSHATAATGSHTRALGGSGDATLYLGSGVEDYMGALCRLSTFIMWTHPLGSAERLTVERRLAQLVRRPAYT